jgi:hypothetical protein
MKYVLEKDADMTVNKKLFPASCRGEVESMDKGQVLHMVNEQS